MSLSNQRDRDITARKRRTLEEQHGLTQPVQPVPPAAPPEPPAPQPQPADPPQAPQAAQPAQPEPPSPPSQSAQPEPRPEPQPAPKPAAQQGEPVSREAFEAEKQRWHARHETLRRNANTMISERDNRISGLAQMVESLQAQNQSLHAQLSASRAAPPGGGNGYLPQPAPAGPTGNGNGSASGYNTARNPATDEWTAEERQVLKRMQDEHGESFMNDFFALNDRLTQRRLMAKHQELLESVDQRLQAFGQRFEAVEETFRRDEAGLFDQQMHAFGHADWQAVRTSQEFHDWLMGHPFGMQWRSMVLPQQPGEGGTTEQVAMILDTFKAQNPALQAASQRGSEAAARAAAAARSDRGTPLVGSEPPPVLPADHLLVSDLGDAIRQHGNNPQKVRELRQRMEASIQAGRLVDNMSGRAPAPFQGGVVP